jgi:hypothetical protein
MKVVIVTADTLLTKTDPLLLSVNTLIEKGYKVLTKTESRRLEEIRQKEKFNEVDRAWLHSIFLNSIKGKAFVDVSRALDDEAKKSIQINVAKAISDITSKYDDVLTVVLSDATDMFIEDVLNDAGLDSVISRTVLIADKKCVGEYGFEMDRVFINNFVGGLKKDKYEVIALGSDSSDAYLMASADISFMIDDIQAFDKYLAGK